MFWTTEVLALIYFVTGEYMSAVCPDTPVRVCRMSRYIGKPSSLTAYRP
jgi:hypothetical protein